MGYGRLGVFGGVYSRDYSTGAGTGKTGTALMLGPTAEGQLWFTREFFAELGFGYGFSSYSQKDIAAGSAATASTAVSASMFRSQFSLGYSYSASPFVFGPKAFAKLGFQSTSFSLPISASEFTGPSKSSGLFLGVGGELPIRGPAVAVMNFDFGIINSASAKDFITASTISSQYVQFFLGGIYRYEPRMSFRFGVNVLGTSADFSDSTSLSQKVISIGPDFIFYF
jgi:hypothetical protein